MTHRSQTDIFIIICIGFQEGLSLLAYRNLWYTDAQVCFLKVLFITWIDHFFQNSTEISSDGRLKTLITFRLINVSGRREFDHQRLPRGGEFDPQALGVGNLNCTLDFMFGVASYHGELWGTRC